MTEKPRLLCVDDEPEVLASIKANLRKRYAVTTAESGAEALSLFSQCSTGTAPFDVVMSDMRMPQMSGAQLLTTLHQRYPNIPRLLLSGQSDLDSAIAAINDAKIFRFLTKPCSLELLVESIDDALEQARLRTAEQDLLNQTLNGTVKLLSEVLGLVDPSAHSRTLRIRETVGELCAGLDRPVSWDLGLATMLSQIGHVVLPADDGTGVDHQSRHAEVAADLLANIPRMGTVTAMIRHQLDRGPAASGDKPTDWSENHLNIEILRTSAHFDALVASGQSFGDAYKTIEGMAGAPPKFILDVLRRAKGNGEAMVQITTTVRKLTTGMELAGDVTLATGPKLCGAGTILTAALLGRIRAFSQSTGINEPISVLVAASSVAESISE